MDELEQPPRRLDERRDRVDARADVRVQSDDRRPLSSAIMRAVAISARSIPNFTPPPAVTTSA